MNNINLIFYKKPIIVWAIFFAFTFIIVNNSSCQEVSSSSNINTKTDSIVKVIEEVDTNNITVNIPTFLGNETRNYYGNTAPSKLKVIWKVKLGTGKTIVGGETKTWSGAGWTGQPLFVTEDTISYLIQGAYDHHLRKINAKTGKVIWKYKFDDVIKGTGTIWTNKKAKTLEEKYVILQGSRRGVNKSFRDKVVPSFRAISYMTGKELWRLNSRLTLSYSRDVDASALIINDTAYIGLENGIFTVFDPDYKKAKIVDGILQPKIYFEDTLYDISDKRLHGGNLVSESSACLLLNRVYVASGSGHVYGYNLKTKKIDWDFFIGSDIDGSPVVTNDSCVLVSVEKQYIAGKGGVFKLNPKKSPKDAAIWYFPTQNKRFASWQGGIIGSVCINDYYKKTLDSLVINDSTRVLYDSIPNVAAFTGIDGYLYVINTKEIDSTKLVLGPDNKTKFKTPKLIFKYKTGSSIATPIIVGNKLIATGYNGVYLFEFNEKMEFKLITKTSFAISESTPIAINGRIYIASRDGYLYCLGSK